MKIKCKIISLTALSLLFMVSSCTKTPEYVILSGKIENDTITKMLVFPFDRTFSETKEPHTIEVKEGVFSDTLFVDEGTYILSDGRNGNALFLKPGMDITVTYAAGKQKIESFTGKGAEYNNYFNLKEDIKGIAKDRYNPELFKLEEAAFVARLKGINDSLTTHLKETKGLSKDFKVKEERNIRYEYLKKIQDYKTVHTNFTKKQSFEPSEGFLSEVEALDLNKEEDFLLSVAYRNLIITKLRGEAALILEKDSLKDFYVTSLSLVKELNDGMIKNKLAFAQAKNEITYTSELDTYYNLFMETSSNEEHKGKIREVYEELSKLAKGNPSPKFIDYENYAGGTTSLDDLKGSYAYLDIWATWCGPCIREIPSLQQLEKDYHGKNIQFVSISIDNENAHETWKKMVADKNLGGIQLYADSSWESQFIKDYMIKGIPRFILLDPEGNIVNPNALRPSEGGLRTLFDELLNKTI